MMLWRQVFLSIPIRNQQHLLNVAGNLSGVTVDTHAIRAVLDALNELEPGSVPLKFIGGKTAAKTKEYQEMYQKDPSTFDAATMVADTLEVKKDGKDVQTEYAVFLIYINK